MENTAQYMSLNLQLFFNPTAAKLNGTLTLLDLSKASWGDPGGVRQSSSEVKAAFAICMHSSKVFRKVLQVDFSRVPTSIPSYETTKVEDFFILPKKKKSNRGMSLEVSIHNNTIIMYPPILMNKYVHQL